ncbi:MAG: hypothetical protein ACRDRI_26015 [Pseudonocardiaceae bacterium]
MSIDVQKAMQDFAQEVQDLLDLVLPRPDDVRTQAELGSSPASQRDFSWLIRQTARTLP